MRALCALLLAVVSFGAGAQNTTIRVVTVFSNEAAYYAQTQGYTMASFVATQLAQANQQYAQSGVNVTLVSAGIRSGICCGVQNRLRYPSDYEDLGPDVGALIWAKNSIPIAQARDDTNADITLVLTDFQDPQDAGGVAGGVCRQGSPRPVTPQSAIVGVDIRRQLYENPVVIAHEVGHILCMEHEYGVIQRSGSTPSDCMIRWTAEFSPELVDTRFGVVTTACWKTSPAAQCYGSPHASIEAVVPPSWRPCTYVLNNSGTSTEWREDWTCSTVGTSQWISNYISSSTTYAFNCTNATSLRYFSNPNVVVGGAAIGDSYRNNAARMNAAAPASPLSTTLSSR